VDLGWRGQDGVVHEWLGNVGMVVEDLAEFGVLLRCSDEMEPRISAGQNRQRGSPRKLSGCTAGRLGQCAGMSPERGSANGGSMPAVRTFWEIASP
jgi:hypothetical protein